jgi:hypothetical protein
MQITASSLIANRFGYSQDKVIVQDPLNPDNNVTKGATRIGEIQ